MARSSTTAGAWRRRTAAASRGVGVANTSSNPTEADDAAPLADPRIGTTIGRYLVGERLGEGGMGVVYAAHDPALDRRVALKLLSAAASRHPQFEARLRREAQALARLDHPNVVQVYDIGITADGLFLAMQLVDGTTLDQLLAERAAPAPRRILELFVAAGRGLAAAHDAGLVHRDIKPSNLFVDRTGRVYVGDFGLARGAERDATTAPDAASLLSTEVTRDGSVLGTPAFMAPEQHRAEPATARTDQFSFCLSLWCALHGEHPFVATWQRAAARDAMARDAIREPPRPARVPARVIRALRRGLCHDPARRWPSMAALVAAIAPRSIATRRATLALAAAAVAMIGIAVAATWLAREPAAADPCLAVTRDLARIWQPSQRPRLAAAFAATGRPDAAATAGRVAAVLDRRAAAWAALRVPSCVAARIDGEQRVELHANQRACLDNQLHELDALVTNFTAAPSGEVVDRSVRVVMGLAPVEDCAQVGRLLDQPARPRDPALELRIDRLAEAVTRARVRDALAGDLPDVAALEQEAAALHADSLIAETAALTARIAFRKSDVPQTMAALRTVMLAAARAHDDALLGQTYAFAAGVLAEAGTPREALELALVAEIASERAGNPASLQVNVQRAFGEAYLALDQFDDSDHAFARAVALLEATPANPLELAMVLNNWASELYDRSDYARSVPLSNRAIAILRDVLGEHHPDLARALQTNGNQQLAIHDYALATARYEEALAIKQANFGRRDPTVAMTVHSLGNLAHEVGDLARADTLYRRALDIWLAASGPTNPNVLMARYSLGMNLTRQHRLAEALDVLEEVLARRIANPDTAQPKIANTLEAVANVHAGLGHLAQATELGQRALAIREKVLGPDTADAAESLSGLASYWAELGDCGKVRSAVARVVAILDHQPNGDRGEVRAAAVSAGAACAAREGNVERAIAGYREAIACLPDQPTVRGEVELDLATLLWRTHRAAARAMARQALADLGPGAPRAHAWLAAHS